MHIKIFLLATLFIASYASDYSDTSDTPNILIGNWNVFDNKATDLSPCCQPSGDVTIVNNYNGTVTLTSTSWTGYDCNARTSSYQDLITVSGNYSYAQLQTNYGTGSLALPQVFDASDNEITIDMSFSPTGMSLVYNLEEVDECYTYYIKSAEVTSVFAVVLIACLTYFIL